MSNLGWSYPAGCDGTPFDEPCGCEVCLKECDSCVCPVCPVCQTHGDPKCYTEHGLVRNQEQITSAKEYEMSQRDRICQVDAETGTYVGDGTDGCYFSTAEGPDGWYASVMVDSDTGGFVDDGPQDMGPYPTEQDAYEAGMSESLEWCADNEVNASQRLLVVVKPEVDVAGLDDLVESLPHAYCDTVTFEPEGSHVTLVFRTDHDCFAGIDLLDPDKNPLIIRTEIIEEDGNDA